MTWLLPTAFVPPSGKVRTVRDGIESVAPQGIAKATLQPSAERPAPQARPAVATPVASRFYVYGFRGEDEFTGSMHTDGLVAAYLVAQSRREAGWTMHIREIAA